MEIMPMWVEEEALKTCSGLFNFQTVTVIIHNSHIWIKVQFAASDSTCSQTMKACDLNMQCPVETPPCKCLQFASTQEKKDIAWEIIAT